MQKEKIIFGFNLIIITAMCIIYFFTNIIPNIIPIHYNIYGEINSYGNKQNLLLLIAIGTFSNVFNVSFINNFNHTNF